MLDRISKGSSQSSPQASRSTVTQHTHSHTHTLCSSRVVPRSITTDGIEEFLRGSPLESHRQSLSVNGFEGTGAPRCVGVSPKAGTVTPDVATAVAEFAAGKQEDRNGDGETDYYRCFNNDHQVTEHFHEFAMGLQSDKDRNFYYAKSARHALTALVPHHGTLLKVAADGSKTEILANGFRAANGVCVNGDGSFYVTDQEGHWTPKNRINRVVPGGFYGNMLGYHERTSNKSIEESGRRSSPFNCINTPRLF